MKSLIGTVVALSASTIIGIHIISNDIKNQRKLSDFIDRCNPQRYTYTELKETVGKTPSNLWSIEQVNTLNDKFLERRKKYENSSFLDNNQLTAKRTGILSICAYGPPDVSGERYYNSYKYLEPTFSDNNYKQWVAEEIDAYKKRIPQNYKEFK